MATKTEKNPYEEAFKRIKAIRKKMTAEQRREMLIKAGILTKKGNVAGRYKKVIVPLGQDD